MKERSDRNIRIVLALVGVGVVLVVSQFPPLVVIPLNHLQISNKIKRVTQAKRYAKEFTNAIVPPNRRKDSVVQVVVGHPARHVQSLQQAQPALEHVSWYFQNNK